MFGSRRIGGIVAATLILAAACGGAATPAPPTAAPSAPPPSVVSSILASGPLASIPAGALFVNVLDLPQTAGGVIKHAHLPGFVYAVQGTAEMDADGAAPAMIQPGNAAFIGAGVMHSHVNPGTSGNDWWFVALRPAASRPLATIVAGQKELYTTPDLTTVATGSYTETLTDSRLPAKGVDRQAGPSIRVLYVIAGDVTVSGDAGMTSTASAGQGLYSLPGANLVLTAGASGAHYITFTMTPTGN
jgi:quercetin dioxygenase-like cupin family protein